ncbi:MAG: STAS/SEC14 domain-containing protein [Chloroflexi bacterium]|nr:STAS/SEC14 domain-containing protein [Chloroflexota bacterium]
MDTISQQDSDAQCVYRPLKEDIHLFIFTESSPQVVDQMMMNLRAIYAARAADGPPLRFLLDFSVSGPLPVNYTEAQLRSLFFAHPQRPPARTAIITHEWYMYTLMDLFLRLLKLEREVVRFFIPEQREEALLWLCNGKTL